MTVRRLRSKQRGPICSFCSKRADLRGVGFSRFACEAHRELLEAEDRRASAPDHSDAAFALGLSP